MAARRSRRGRQRRRGRFGVLYPLLSVALILAAIAGGCVVFFRVDTISVEGNSRYTREQIIEATEVEQGDNLFLLDKINLSRQLLVRLPYIASVEISRRLPDGLEIAVTECVAAAAIEGEGAWWILNAKGKFVERTDRDGAAGIPAVTGMTPLAPIVGTKLEVSDEETLKGEALLALMAALEEQEMLADIRGYNLTAPNVVLAEYAGRFTLKMHMSGTDYTKETRAVREALRQFSENESGVIDFTLEGDPHLIQYPK